MQLEHGIGDDYFNFEGWTGSPTPVQHPMAQREQVRPSKPK